MLDIKKLEELCPVQLNDVVECVMENHATVNTTMTREWALDLIAKMDYMEFFSAYLNWNGIVGHTQRIALALDGARAAIQI